MLRFLFFTVSFLFTLSVAQNIQAAQESTYTEIAKSRKYIGGADESDLKVQPTLNRSQNKKKKPINSDSSDGF